MQKRRKKRKLKKIVLVRILLFLVVILGSCLIANGIYFYEQQKIEKERIEKEQRLLTEKERIYEECINTPFLSEATSNQILELETEYQNKYLSFYFEDINNQYTITKDEERSYYGASIIKLVEALYLIQKAMDQEVDLNETKVYEAKYKAPYSSGMITHQIGDEVTLRELITHAITVSDNTAHFMLFDYIGLSNLREYANSISVHLTATESERYGNLRAIDGYYILKEAYRILSLNNEYSEFLKSIMDNDYFNSLNFDTKRFLHKYGFTEPYYNDIGIYFDEKYPYLLSVFTSYAYSDYSTIVETLSKKIYEIYEANLLEKEEVCISKKESFVLEE